MAPQAVVRVDPPAQSAVRIIRLTSCNAVVRIAG
jgi:hypothetical protein